MTTERIPTPSSLPTAEVGKSDSEHPASIADALTLAMVALVTASTILAKNQNNSQLLNNTISDFLTKQQENQLKQVLDKLADYYHQLEKQKSSTNWLHYIGIGYIMDAVKWISKKIDALLGKVLSAMGVPAQDLKFITGIIKAALVVALVVAVGVASGGSLAAIGLTAGLALMFADPSQDLVVGGVEAFGGDQNIAAIASACLSAVLMIATMVVGGVGASTMNLSELVAKMPQTVQKLAALAPTVAKIGTLVGGGAAIAQGGSSMAAGAYGISAAKDQADLAPLQGLLQALTGAVQLNTQYTKVRDASDQAADKATQADKETILDIGRAQIQIAKETHIRT